MTEDKLNVISFGAGKQSSYMLIKAIEGAFKFKPDFAIFSDTGCEPSWTYENLNSIKEYVKNKYDFDIVIVKRGIMTSDIIDYINDETKPNPQIPLRTEATGGLLLRHCTSDYKIAPLKKYLQKVRLGKKVRLWIGISLDEMERMKYSGCKYIDNYYPLVEKRIRIEEIKQWFQNEMIIPEPGKSSCIICPFRSRKSWLHIKKYYPNDFKIAVDFDDKIRAYPKIVGNCYIHPDLIPISEIKEDTQTDMFPELIEECFGICGL